MRWVCFVLSFSFSYSSLAQAPESGIGTDDLISAADYAAWAGRTLDQGDVYEEIYQFSLSGGSYRVIYEHEGEDYEFVVQATIAPDAESAEIEFERILDGQLHYFDGFELIEIPELAGIGDRSVGYHLWLDGEQDGVALVAKSRHVAVTIDIHPYPAIRYDLMRERVLTVLNTLASVDHQPDLGLLTEVNAANVSTEYLYRFEDFARGYGMAYDQGALEESLEGRHFPGEAFALTYDALLSGEPALSWTLIISQDADKSGHDMLRENLGDTTKNRIQDRQFENWNDGSLGFGSGALQMIITSHEDKMLMLQSPTGFGTPAEAIERLSPYLDSLMAIDPVLVPAVSAPAEQPAAGERQSLAVAEDDSRETERFAESGAFSGDIFVVGSPRNWREQRRFEGMPPGIIRKGAAYVYLRGQAGSQGWSEAQRILAPDVDGRDYFGKAVAFDGDTLIIGLSEGEEPDQHLGSIAIYQRSQGGSGQWEQVTTLSAPGVTGDGFGAAVSVDGDTLAVGAPNTARKGTVYVFSRHQGGADHWGQVKALQPVDDGDVIGAFGGAVQLHGDTLVVGAPATDVDGGFDDGAAYIFSRNAGGAGNWGQVHKLIAPDVTSSQTMFAESVAVQGDTVVIGTGVHHNGAYVFSRHHGGEENWGEVKRFAAPGIKFFGDFGGAVDLDGGTIVVAASRDQYERDDGTLGTGSVYVYSRDAGGPENWGQVKKILVPEHFYEYSLGSFVSIEGDTLVVGHAPASVMVFSRNEGGSENWGLVTDFTLPQ